MRRLAGAAILVRILQAVSQRARRYVNDPKQMEQLVTDAQERAVVVERAGSMAQQTLAALRTMARMGRAFVRREYRTVPWGTIVGATAAVLYFVMPVDFIPDVLIGMGLIDDAALIAFVATRIMGDLDNYAQWERERHGGAITAETAAIDGTARVIDSAETGAVSGVMEDVYLASADGEAPPLPDDAIADAGDAMLDAVEKARRVQHRGNA